MPTASDTEVSERVARRAEALYGEHRDGIFRRVDRLFAGLMLGQWVFAIVVAAVYSPYGWSGKVQTFHVHLYAAVLLGGALSGLPIALALLRPGWVANRYVIACAQMLWSALLIHLTGGRIETHFHVFGSLAFLAFYRDWKVLLPATVVVAGDHLVRQLYWPESVYGVTNPEWWRFLEHAFWVVFEDTVLVLACVRGTSEMRHIAMRQAQVEALSQSERRKSEELDAALRDLQQSHEALIRNEKLAAVGQLAASVGHELRNPLAVVKNASSYIEKRLGESKVPVDAKVPQFLGMIKREIGVCTKIIGDLLDFARERRPNLEPCPLRPLVDEAVGVVPAAHVRIRNEVPASLPVPEVDRDQFRQVFLNLLQNAVEAIPPERDGGEVVVSAEGGGGAPWRIFVSDNGGGIPEDVVPRIFEPLFTTKTKGTGLGLAVVANMVRQHQGTIQVQSEVGSGSRFVIELPAPAPQKQVA